MTAPFRVAPGFEPRHRADAAGLYWQAFGAKLGKVLGPEPRARAFFERVLDPSHAHGAFDPDGRLIGLAGFKTADGALIDGGWADLRATYGRLGALWRAPLLALVERPVAPDILLMDGISVRADARGLGVGSALLAAIVDEARRRGARAVRLDVVERNHRARALYERRGFEPVATESAGPLRHVFGFRRSTTMLRPVTGDTAPAP